MALKYSESEPLHLALEQGDLNRVRELLDSGMNADVKDIHHRTPLMIAARKGAIDIARLLIERGADVNAKDRRSSVWDGRCTPLHFACETGQIEMAGFLIDNGADPDCITQCWLNPLSTAITEKRQQLVELLLEKGASANGPEKCACPPLNAAAMIKDAALVKKLLQLGADPNRIGGWGDAALHSTHSFECARELVAGGANANLKDRSGTTALHCLLGVINPEYISLLIEAGANVNEIATDSGYTPLHILASLPSAENAKVLIEAGADVNVLSKQKQTPLDMCLYLLNKELNDNRERQRLADLLRQHGGKTAKEL